MCYKIYLNFQYYFNPEMEIFILKFQQIQLFLCAITVVIREHSHMTSDIFWEFLTYLST